MKQLASQLEESRQQAAAAWLARRDRGLRGGEAAEFAAWLAADVRNAEALRDLEDSFHALNCTESLRSPGAASPDPDFLVKRAAATEVRSRPRKVIPFKTWIAAGAAMAAGVALAFVLSREPAPSEPAMARSRGTVVRHVAETMHLPDGSVLELKPGAKVEVQFEAAERRVRLVSGEAHFTVAKDPSRPFIVGAGDLAVRAVGTAFNVRLNNAAVEVLVTEGRVAVRDSNHAATPATQPSDVPLVAGQRAVVPATGLHQVAIAMVGTDEVERDLAWRATWLEFVEMRLDDVVSEFNRHNGGRITVADDDTGSVLVSGNFKADGADAFVRILESTFGVTAERRGDAVVLKRQR